MMDQDTQHESGLRGIKPLAIYGETAGLDGGPASIAEAMNVASSMMADVLHMISRINETDRLPLGDASRDGHVRALKVIDDAFEMYLDEAS